MNTIIVSTTRQELPKLHESTVRKLKELRATDTAAFYLMVKSLRENKWPLRAIATPLGVSRSAVADWETKASENAPLPEAEEMTKVAKSLRPLYQKVDIPEDSAKTMYSLAREASKVRRYTDYASPSRLAARELETLLHFYKDQGASLSDLADVCGVTRRAIAQRLEKAAG